MSLWPVPEPPSPHCRSDWLKALLSVPDEDESSRGVLLLKPFRDGFWGRAPVPEEINITDSGVDVAKQLKRVWNLG